MVQLIGMVDEGWYMVQKLKLWYDYIIMVRSGNAALDKTFEMLVCWNLTISR